MKETSKKKEPERYATLESVRHVKPPQRDVSQFPEVLVKQAKEESQLVKGRFKNYAVPGGMMEVNQRKFHPALAPPFKKIMFDEGIYEIPLWVARWLNGVDSGAPHINGAVNYCRHPIHGFKHQKQDEVKFGVEDRGGVPRPSPTEPVKWERRVGFESLTFDMNVA